MPRFDTKLRRKVHTKEEAQVQVSADQILGLVQHLIPDNARNVRAIFLIPGGGDYSNSEAGIEDVNGVGCGPVFVRWEVVEHVETATEVHTRKEDGDAEASG